MSAAAERIQLLQAALSELAGEVHRVDALGARLAAVLVGGGRLLAAGNGGSAAEAQHLTAELVGRYRHERRPLSAIALSAETSSLTAIGNDYGYDEVFARQVAAHGRPGDVLVLLSASGRSANVVRAAERGRECGLQVWSLTGPGPNPLAERSDEALCVAAAECATVQEVHLVVLHLLCAAVDDALGVAGPAAGLQAGVRAGVGSGAVARAGVGVERGDGVAVEAGLPTGASMRATGVGVAR